MGKLRDPEGHRRKSTARKVRRHKYNRRRTSAQLRQVAQGTRENQR